MFTWLFRLVLSGLIATCVFIFNNMWSESKAAHDAIIRLEERSIQEKSERNMWQQHMETRIGRIESKLEQHGK